MALSVAVGMVGVAAYAAQTGLGAPAIRIGSTAGFLAAASLGAGAIIGFLFGIPRALQGDGRTRESGKRTENTEGTESRKRSHEEALYQPNTNLEQISDWLTKILVGLGLSQISQVPDKTRRLTSYLQAGFPEAVAATFVLGVTLYFLAVGFLFSYLLTRLFLVGAFTRADHAALRRVEEIAQEARQKADETAAETQAAAASLERKIVSAQQPSPVAESNKPPAEALDELRREFWDEQDRRKKGEKRPGRKDAVVRGMIEVCRELELSRGELEKRIGAEELTERLSAYAYLHVNPTPSLAPTLVDRVLTMNPETDGFEQYWALSALRRPGAIAPGTVPRTVVDRLASLLEKLDRTSDRHYELQQVLRALQGS